MPTLKEIKRVFACEVNDLTSPPFPVSLPAGGTVDLCKLTVPLDRCPSAFLVTAVVNWSVTFTPIPGVVTSDFPGSAQITFELLRDGGPIQRVTQPAIQLVFSGDAPSTTASTTFEIATLRHVDTTSLGGITNPLATFLVRATNIILNPPLEFGTTPVATVTAAAGLTSLTVEEVDACRAAAANA